MQWVHTPSGVLLQLPYFMAVGLGLIPTQSRVGVLGHNPSIGANAAADVWEGSGDYNWLSTASPLEIVSTNSNDTALGVGARTILLQGLDINRNRVQEVLTTNGETPVTTVNSYLRRNLFSLQSSGTNKKNIGDITLRAQGGGAILDIMRAGYGFGRSAVFSVPTGFTFFAYNFAFTVLQPNGVNTDTAVFAFMTQQSNGTQRIAQEFQVTSLHPYYHRAELGLVLPAGVDLSLRVTRAGQAGTNVTASLEGVLIDNKALL